MQLCKRVNGSRLNLGTAPPAASALPNANAPSTYEFYRPAQQEYKQEGYGQMDNSYTAQQTRIVHVQPGYSKLSDLFLQPIRWKKLS